MKFQLIVISPPENSPGETDLLIQLFNEGLKIFHLRKPGYNYTQVKNYLESIPVKFHSRIVIHSHYKLSCEFALKGIHLTESSRKKSSVLKFIREKKPERISASFHSVAGIKKSKRKYNYVFLSPVFDSISKKGYHSGFDLIQLENELTALQKKQQVIALGGITEKNISAIKTLGFSGAATLGYIWESKDPLRSFAKLRSKIS